MRYWWNPSTPDDLQPVPWMHPAAVLYLESLLSPDMTVIEHGCGGSTLWFVDKVRELHGYDIDSGWLLEIGKTVLKYEHVFIHEQRYPPTVIHADLLFIDGHNQDRPEWIRSAPSIVKPGGVVVVDNSEREYYQAALRELAAHCHAPTIITAWTDYGKLVQTSFYRLKGGVSWI